MNNLLIKRSQIVEAQITGTPATQRRYAFTEIPNLSRNNIKLYGIEVYTAGQLAATPLGNTVVADADIDQIVVTLKDNENNEFIYQMPIFTLNRTNNGGFITLIEPRIINLTDCYVQLVDTTGISANEVVAFNFYYDLV